MGNARARLKHLVLAAAFGSLAAGCPAIKPIPQVADDGEVVDTGGAKPGGATAAKSVIFGTLSAAPLAIIGNNTPLAPAYRLAFSLQGLTQDPVSAAQISLVDAEGQSLGKAAVTGSDGAFGFPEIADAAGTFFVLGKFEAGGGSFEFRGVMARKAGETAGIRLDIASTLVAAKVKQLLAAGKLALADLDMVALGHLTNRVRDKLAKEQVPFMVVGSEDIVSQMDQLAFDDLEILGLATQAHRKLGAQSDTWTVTQLIDTAKAPTGVTAADVGQAGPLAADKDGNLYVPAFSTGGTIAVYRVTQAGQASPVGSIADSRSPVALAFGPDGTIFAADFREDARQIRLLKGTAFGVVATMSWPVGGSPEPAQLAVDGAGTGFVALGSHHVVARLVPGATTSILIGLPGGAGYKDGAAAEARFNRPSGVAIGPDGACWVADRDNFVLRSIAPDGKVSTEAGAAGDGFYRSGRASFARFGGPSSLAIKGGTVFVADMGARRVRRLSPDGMIFTIAGAASASAGGGAGDVAGFSRIEALAADDKGALFVRDAQVNAAGNVTGYLIRKIARP